MKYNGWNTTLFSLVFIAAPAVIGYVFLLPDWTQKQVLNYGYLWLIGLAFIFYVCLITYCFIFLKILIYDSLIFTIPMALVLHAIFVTYPLYWWIRALIVFAIIFSVIPINIFVQNVHSKKR